MAKPVGIKEETDAGVDPGLYGCIAALVWVLHRNGIAMPHHIAHHRRLGPRYRRLLAMTRLGVACIGASVIAVSLAGFVAAVLPGFEGAALYLAGVGTALVLLVLVEATTFRLRNAIAREALRRDRARSVRTMMRLGLGPRSEQMF
ncbi:MAG: hypothetical protein HC807_05970 [Gammaproteobacteria bacterium]|nr:hypothetical protein [Gammaproteobacteria bacterium]